MMTENSRNMQPRDIVVLHNKLLCMTNNRVVCIRHFTVYILLLEIQPQFDLL